MADVLLCQKSGGEVTPLRVREPDDELTAMLKMKDELAGMIQRCQSLLLTAAESPPEGSELDAMQERLDELREQLALDTNQ
jgi:hypothetical protein